MVQWPTVRPWTPIAPGSEGRSTLYPVALTQQSVLRAWLTSTLHTLGGMAERAVVLNRLEQDFGHLMTDDDRQAVRSRPFEEKWRNRASYERAQMVREGILADRRDGVWQLTS